MLCGHDRVGCLVTLHRAFRANASRVYAALLERVSRVGPVGPCWWKSNWLARIREASRVAKEALASLIQRPLVFIDLE